MWSLSSQGHVCSELVHCSALPQGMGQILLERNTLWPRGQHLQATVPRAPVIRSEYLPFTRESQKSVVPTMTGWKTFLSQSQVPDQKAHTQSSFLASPPRSVVTSSLPACYSSDQVVGDMVTWLLEATSLCLPWPSSGPGAASACHLQTAYST